MAGFRPHPARPGPDRAAKPQAAAWQPMTPALRLAAQPVCSMRTTSRSFGRLVSFLAFAARFRAGWRGQAPTPRSGAITVDSASVVSLACRSPSRCDLARMVSIRTMTMFPVIFANTRQSQPRRSRNPHPPRVAHNAPFEENALRDTGILVVKVFRASLSDAPQACIAGCRDQIAGTGPSPVPDCAYRTAHAGHAILNQRRAASSAAPCHGRAVREARCVLLSLMPVLPLRELGRPEGFNHGERRACGTQRRQSCDRGRSGE